VGTIVRAAAAYLMLLFIFRIIGRRSVDRMTTFDLIVVFMLGGMMIQAVVSDDRSLSNGFLAVMTIGLMHVLVAWAKQRSSMFGRITDGTPIILLGRGEWHHDHMDKTRVQETDIMAAARLAGLERVEQVKYAILERNGSIAIIKDDAHA
jgi:uncharacterized membrane protein YcaP (DUF421 family)